jgi:hypothetical protein
VYHLISRFTAKEWFIQSAVERAAYLILLGRSIAWTDWRCFSFALMSSHVHLGVLAGSIPLADWLRPMHTAFAEWINERRERIGGVFVRGPKLIQFQRAGTAQLINYIHHNPVRAGVVSNPLHSNWTSHPAYAGIARRPSWLSIECGVALTGFDSAATLATWIESTTTSRSELEAVRAVPYVGRGRPAKDKSLQGRVEPAPGDLVSAHKWRVSDGT